MKKYLAPSLIMLAGICFITYGCLTNEVPNKKVVHTYETDDLSFKNGEILYPDYVHDDTIIVSNADSLNWCMENYNIASDGDIWDVLHAYSNRIIKQTTDERGLISVIYENHGDTLALDYLTKEEYNKLFSK